MTLRPYQSDQVALIRQSFANGNKRIVLCSPTGSGKSLVMAEMCRLAYEKGSRVLLLTHRMELFKSTLSHLGRSGIPCASLNAGNKMPQGDWRVLLAMERTIWNRIIREPNTILAPDLIIADEIHFQNFSKILDHFFTARVIGFSATPQGNHLHKIYTDIVQNIDVPELVEQGWLVPCKAFQMQDDFSDVKISKGEFEDASLFKHFDKPKLYAGIIDEYNNHVRGQKGIVFCCNIKHVENTFQIFQESGVNTFKVHSEMSDDERKENVTAFESCPDGVMINNGILTTGYDHPAIQFVILYRATTSLPLFLQMIGRGSRPHQSKSSFTVLDFGQNHTRHGLWNQSRTWTLDPPKKKGKTQAAPVKNCPQCTAMLAASVMKCEYCGYIFIRPETELKDGVMVLFETNTPVSVRGKRMSELTISELIECQKVKKISSHGVWRILKYRGNDEIYEYQKQIGYSPGWAYNQVKDLQQKGRDAFKYRDLIIQ